MERGAERCVLDGLERKRRDESEAYAKHRLQPKLKLWLMFCNVQQVPSSDRSALEGASNATSHRAAHARGYCTLTKQVIDDLKAAIATLAMARRVVAPYETC